VAKNSRSSPNLFHLSQKIVTGEEMLNLETTAVAKFIAKIVCGQCRYCHINEICCHSSKTSERRLSLKIKAVKRMIFFFWQFFG